MYKDKEKQQAATREAVRRHREKGITEGITKQGITSEGITCPDIIDKLTDPFWRGRLEKVCLAFKSSHHPSYSQDVWLGDTNLSTVCDYLECTV